jgi:putative spermidine/putrescine transport system permease protein
MLTRAKSSTIIRILNTVLAMAIHSYTGMGGRVWHYAYLSICAMIFAMLVVPILIIFPLSLNAEPYFSFSEGMMRLDPSAFSTKWYEEIFGINTTPGSRGQEWASSLRNSVSIALASTLLATLLGTTAAVGLSRAYMPGRRFIMALLISPLIVPIIITATGMFLFYSSVGLAYTYIGIVLAHTAIGAPYVIITVTATLVGFPEELIRASFGLGAPPSHTFRKIIFPLIAPGVLSGALFAFITSFDDIVLIYFLGNVEQRTIPMKMWSGLRESLSPNILAASSVLVVLAIAALLTAELLRRRTARLRGKRSDESGNKYI